MEGFYETRIMVIHGLVVAKLKIWINYMELYTKLN